VIRKSVLVFAVLFALAAVGQRHDAWEIIGPGGGEFIRSLTERTAALATAATTYGARVKGWNLGSA
jgi:hypothetical protein